MATLAELKREKAELASKAREIRDNFEESDDHDSWSAYKEKRGYDEIMDDRFDLKEQIDDMEVERELEREQEESRANGDGPRAGRPDAGDGGEDERRDLPPLFPNRSEAELGSRERKLDMAYRNYADHFAEDRGVDPVEYRDRFRNWLSLDRNEQLPPEQMRDLSAGSDPDGGFTVPPNFAANLLQKLDDEVVIRQFATVIPVNTGDSLGIPTLETDPSDPVWTQEVNTGDEDSAMAFGDRELHPHPLAKRIKVSRKLIRSSAIGVEATVRERLGYKFRVAEEKGFMTGSGSQEPLGLFTADSNGISTSRDVTEDANTTSTTFDHLKSVKWSLKAAYQDNARWITHRDIGKQIDKLKDGEGQYIWQMSTQADEPDRLLGAPVSFSEFAPSSTTSSDYIAIYGDFSFYQIADALDMTMQRLVELYAEENKIGFIGRLEADGMPVFEEAFARAQLA